MSEKATPPYPGPLLPVMTPSVTPQFASSSTMQINQIRPDMIQGMFAGARMANCTINVNIAK